MRWRNLFIEVRQPQKQFCVRQQIASAVGCFQKILESGRHRK